MTLLAIVICICNPDKRIIGKNCYSQINELPYFDVLTVPLALPTASYDEMI